MVEGNLGGSSISKLKTLEKLQLHHLPAQDREQWENATSSQRMFVKMAGGSPFPDMLDCAF